MAEERRRSGTSKMKLMIAGRRSRVFGRAPPEWRRGRKSTWPRRERCYGFVSTERRLRHCDERRALLLE
jgi:hypothetical protein